MLAGGGGHVSYVYIAEFEYIFNWISTAHLYCILSYLESAGLNLPLCSSNFPEPDTYLLFFVTQTKSYFFALFFKEIIFWHPSLSCRCGCGWLWWESSVEEICRAWSTTTRRRSTKSGGGGGDDDVFNSKVDKSAKVVVDWASSSARRRRGVVDVRGGPHIKTRQRRCHSMSSLLLWVLTICCSHWCCWWRCWHSRCNSTCLDDVVDVVYAF